MKSRTHPQSWHAYEGAWFTLFTMHKEATIHLLWSIDWGFMYAHRNITMSSSHPWNIRSRPGSLYPIPELHCGLKILLRSLCAIQASSIVGGGWNVPIGLKFGHVCGRVHPMIWTHHSQLVHHCHHPHSWTLSSWEFTSTAGAEDVLSIYSGSDGAFGVGTRLWDREEGVIWGKLPVGLKGEPESWLLLWLSLQSLELILCISLGYFFGGINCWGSYNMHKLDLVMYAYFVNQNSHSPYYWKTYLEPKLTRLPSFHFIFMLYGDGCHDNYLFWS